MENNETVINQYNGYISEIETLISKVEKDTILDRKQRNKLIEYLDSAINHCKGKIQFLNGTYVPNHNNFKRGF